MKNVSNNFKEELHNGNRKYVKSCDITLVDGTVLNITEKNTWQNGFLLDSAVTNDGSFDIGSAMSDQFVLTLNNIYDEYSAYDFAKAQVSNVKVGLRLSNGNYEYVKQGMFVVDEPQYNGSTIRLECYDNMIKFDKDYSLSNLAFPATLNSIVIDACECCDVSMSASMTNLRNNSYVVDNKPVADNLTFRQVLVWVAEICGVWFKCDENGALSYKAIDTLVANELYDNMQIDSDKCHHIVSTMGIELSTDDVVITGIEVVEKGEETNTSYFEGTKDYFLSIQDNELIQNGKGQTVVSYLGELFNGLRFRPMQLKCLTDPTIEVGDYAFVTDRKGVSYFTILTQVSFAPGEFQSVSCEAESPEK